MLLPSLVLYIMSISYFEILFTHSKETSYILSYPVKNSNLLIWGSFTLQGSSGCSINHTMMDRHPIPGSFVPPLLIELQHLILIEYWRLIYMIQVQSKQWFFSVKDSSSWHACTEIRGSEQRTGKQPSKRISQLFLCIRTTLHHKCCSDPLLRKKKPVVQPPCYLLKNTQLYLHTQWKHIIRTILLQEFDWKFASAGVQQPKLTFWHGQI